MRIVTERQLAIVFGGLADTPRVVVGGNFATPWRALSVLDGTLARYRLFALNAQAAMPGREGVTLESPFVGPGMRGQSGLRYFPHSYIVSEQGAAVVWGHDAPGQAEQVIDHVAHPSVREQLRAAGRSLGLGH
jgi:hypothetical protein